MVKSGLEVEEARRAIQVRHSWGYTRQTFEVV